MKLTKDLIDDIYPLSPMQQGMLFHSLYEETGTAYVNQMHLDIIDIDLKKFKQAWDTVIARHDILRTGFISHLEEPLQWVAKKADLSWSEEDWRDKEGIESDLESLAKEEVKSIDLLKPPLMRVAIIRTSDNNYRLIWTMHHIILDGWSSSKFTSELFGAYSGQPLKPVQAQYKSYIAWLNKQDKVKSKEYWKGQISKIVEPTLISNKINNKNHNSYGYCGLNFNEEQTKVLIDFCRKNRITMNILVQSVWSVFLSRYTGQQTICFGAVVSGRPTQLEHSESMIGLFINTLPVIVDTDPNQTVSSFLSSLQKLNLSNRDYEHTPLSDIQDWYEKGQALFDSIVVFENYPSDNTYRLDGQLESSFKGIKSSGNTNFPMGVEVNLTDTLNIEFIYQKNQFDSEQVKDISKQVLTLINEFKDNENRCLGNLASLPSLDVKTLIKNKTNQFDTPKKKPIHEIIAEYAITAPNKVALVMDDCYITYEQLHNKVVMLTNALMDKGVKPLSKIGVAMTRSPDVIVSFLAILSVGGIYVPFDIKYPIKRTRYIIEDSDIQLLLTDNHVRHLLPHTDNTYDVAELIKKSEKSFPKVEIHQDMSAYIIYTSGSTGQPKGVLVNHGSLSMHCQAISEQYGMTSDSIEFHFMSFSFDGAHERWITTLITGATLILRDEELWTVEQTCNALIEHKVTSVAFPPAYLIELAKWADEQQLTLPVKLYCFGGEAMSKSAYDYIRRILKPDYFINGYGPTETVVTPMLWKTPASETFNTVYAPVGLPVGDRSVYVLDQYMQLIPEGGTGELYIGGQGVSQGYLNQYGLTAERFVANPFSNDGSRLYRSGDLVKWLEDGNLAYIGRIDHQVKVRGFRIEIGEIELSIRELDSVKDVVIIAEAINDTHRLVAYIESTEALEVQAIKSILTSQLPDYMIPQHFIFLSNFPRMVSGKLDRTKLPAVDIQNLDDYQAPSTPESQILVKIWQKVLGVDKVGETDNFYELGGDSLKSLRIVSELKKLNNPKLKFSLKDIIQQPTIVQLLQLDGQNSDNKGIISLNKISNTQSAIVCIHGGLGTTFDYQPLANVLDNKKSVKAIPYRGLTDSIDDNYYSLVDMAKHYAEMIVNDNPKNNYTLLGWSLGGTLAVMTASVLEKQGYQVDKVYLIDAFIPSENHRLKEDGSWQGDLINFITHILELPVDSVKDTVTSSHNFNLVEVQSLIDSLLTEHQHHVDPVFQEMGSEEIVRIFSMGYQLKQLSLNIDTLPSVLAPVECWWIEDRDRLEIQKMYEMLQQNPRYDCYIKESHFKILRSKDFITDFFSKIQ